MPSNQLIFETANDLNTELSRFRTEWRNELSKQEANKDDENIKPETTKSKNIAQYREFPRRNLSSSNEQKESDDLEYEQPNNEQKAQYLFNKGVLLEQQGRHFEGNLKFRIC